MNTIKKCDDTECKNTKIKNIYRVVLKHEFGGSVCYWCEKCLENNEDMIKKSDIWIHYIQIEKGTIKDATMLLHEALNNLYKIEDLTNYNPEIGLLTDKLRTLRWYK
jgi:hypothetical protein